jgi:hypothetical protein
MSLWTPGGEHEVPPEPAPQGAPPEGAGPGGMVPGGPDLDDLSPEERARAEQLIGEMAEAQRQLVEAPIDVVLGNHLIGFYELAALHLQQDPPNLTQAQMAIDALAAVLHELTGRLGDTEEPLRNALSQIQAAFVEVKSRTEG